MEIKKLELENFCAYIGKQTFNLKVKKSKPVIVLGGLNGGGKTTIIDAIQLVLYGKKASLSKKGKLSYNNFLESCIHSSEVETCKNSSIELSFQVSQPQISNYTIKRSWDVFDNKLNETFTVIKDDQEDEWIASNWLEYVEGIVPQSLSKLFFFDAEKVQNIIDSNDQHSISSSIKSLLGLDIADRLLIDTKILKKNLVINKMNETEKKEYEQIHNYITDTLNTKIESTKNELSQVNLEISKINDSLLKKDEDFMLCGGDHWKNKNQFLTKKKEIEFKINQRSENLIELAAQEVPILLLEKQLNDLKDKAQEGTSLQLTKGILKEIKAIEKEFEKIDRIPKKVKEIIEKKKTKFINKKNKFSTPLPSGCLSFLDETNSSFIASRKEQIQNYLKETNQLKFELDQVNRDLNAVPNEEKAGILYKEIKELQTSLGKNQSKIDFLEKEIRNLENEKATKVRQLQKILEKEELNSNSNHSIQRIKQRIDQSQDLIKKYINLSIQKKINFLSDNITESFNSLIRKKNFVKKVKIDPNTFKIQIEKSNGEVREKDGLSEGEKQIFAIAFLWGLAKTSHKEIPMVVDTPLGRLDSKHRAQLMKNYFPFASHQVIVLSTDTEVQQEDMELLKNKISKTYLLDYDQKKNCTYAKEDLYFWN